jgi:DNA-binding beta-propeller fold protein YncE
MVVQTVIQDVVMMGTLGGAYSDIAFGPDEKFLYAVNQLSRDVTVFDTANLSKGTVIENTGGARHMRLLPESGLLAVLAGDEKLILIDTTTNTVIKERKFGGNFMFLGDGKDAIALSRKTHSVYLLNGETLEVIRSAGGFKDPYQYVLSPD